jgi:serine phosphatase RsbU (regulator of sigma subunit)
LNEAIRDGFSTGGTPGNGLGAVKRLSSTFEAYSAAPAGTVLLSRLYSENQETTPLALDVGVVCLPKRGELACGDAWHVEQTPTGRTMIIVADGLGHGLLAAEASRQAIRLFRENLHLDTVRMMQVLHEGMRATRGAAIAVAEIKQDQKELRFTGVGNISASIYVGLNSRSLVSQNGTVGAEARRIQEFTYPWTPDSLLLMHSDGLSSQAQIAKYAGLRFKHPSLIAGVLYRDFRRERDDATVMVLSASRSVR